MDESVSWNDRESFRIKYMKAKKMKFILASKSPRRKELLEQTGISFEVMVSDADENIKEKDPAKFVEKLSKRKAEAVLSEMDSKRKKESVEEFTIIGSDTIVIFDGEVMGKPKDKKDARRMLKKLSGQTHEVYTGVTILYIKNGKKRTKSFHECTKVKMYPISDEQLDEYLNQSLDWADKAGAYGIQEEFGARYIKRIKGDYNNVVGLPTSRLYQELIKSGLI